MYICGARENTPCAVRAKRVVFPLALVDVALQQQRHVADDSCPRARRQVCVLHLARECRNRDCKEGGKTLAVVTITIRPHPLVVMPKVCGTQQQQQYEYTYDTCWLLSRCVFLCLALLFSAFYHACCPRRVGTRHYANPDAIVGYDFIPNPHFRVEAVPKTISENGSMKNHRFRVHKGCKPVFGIRKRPLSGSVNGLTRYKRWP